MATPANRLGSAARYKIEIDGFPTIYADNADLPEATAKPHSYQAGNELVPRFGPATYTVGEFVFRHATALGNVDVLMAQWFKDFHRGAQGKKNARCIFYGPDRRTPLRTYEMLDCFPTAVKPEEHAGDSEETSRFSFTLQPEDFNLV